jgi:hypothetical protein
MARLSTEIIEIKDPGGRKEDALKIKFDISVDKEGFFATTLSSDIVQMFKNAGIDMSKNRMGNDGYLVSNTKEGLIREVSNIAKEFMSRECIEDIVVIRYLIQTQCTYALTKDGDIVPNMTDEFGGEKWIEGTIQTHAQKPTAYGVQIYVNPCVKKTYRYLSGKTKVEYDKFSPFGSSYVKDKKKAANLYWLEQVCSMALPQDGFGSNSKDLKEMLYTEERAAFFVNLIKSICMMNEKIKSMAMDTELLIKTIENKSIGNKGDLKLLQ